MATSLLGSRGQTPPRMLMLKSRDPRESEEESYRSTSLDTDDDEPGSNKHDRVAVLSRRLSALIESPAAASSWQDNEEEKQPDNDYLMIVDRSATPLLLECKEPEACAHGSIWTSDCCSKSKTLSAIMFEELPFPEGVTDDSRSTPKVSSCPNNHDLQEFASCMFGFFCDACATPQVIGTTLWGCRRCNFDVCKACVSDEALLKCCSQRRCRQGHGMVEKRWTESHSCDICSRRLEPGTRLYACMHCDYDECVRCAEGKDTTFYEILGVNESASSEDIERAAWNLSRQCRRSAVKNPQNEYMRLEASARFSEIAVAFSTLIDPELRKDYDEFLKRSADAPYEINEYHLPNERKISPHRKDDISKWFLIPQRKHGRNQPEIKPSVAHGAFVAVGGVLYAPLSATSVGTLIFVESVVDGAKQASKGFCRGGASFKQGMQELVTGETSRPRRRKVNIGEHVRAWHSVQREKPWRMISRVITEPVHGITMATAYMATGAVAGATVAVCGSLYGVGANFSTGRREIREAIKLKLKKRGAT